MRFPTSPRRSLLLALAMPVALALAACGGATPPPTQSGPSAGRSCGGLVPSGTAEACADGEYCMYAPEAMCGAADAPGVCRPRPEACTMDYRPVCGCDDRTYSNACAAASAGVSVVSEGECARTTSAEGEICGTRGAMPCGPGLFCNFPPGANCGRADAPGTCAPVPQACTREYRPVCGCDGTTYPTACVANAASVSVETEGACAGAGR